MPPATRRSRILVAGLCCTAVVAVALTTHVVGLVVVLQTFEPPPDVEGPSVFAAMLLVGGFAAGMAVEAVAVWVVFTDVLRHFPGRRRTAYRLLVGVAVLHALLTAMLLGSAEPWYVLAVGAIVPLAAAAAVLLARAPG